MSSGVIKRKQYIGKKETINRETNEIRRRVKNENEQKQEQDKDINMSENVAMSKYSKHYETQRIDRNTLKDKDKCKNQNYGVVIYRKNEKSKKTEDNIYKQNNTEMEINDNKRFKEIQTPDRTSYGLDTYNPNNLTISRKYRSDADKMELEESEKPCKLKLEIRKLNAALNEMEYKKNKAEFDAKRARDELSRKEAMYENKIDDLEREIQALNKKMHLNFDEPTINEILKDTFELLNETLNPKADIESNLRHLNLLIADLNLGNNKKVVKTINGNYFKKTMSLDHNPNLNTKKRLGL